MSSLLEGARAPIVFALDFEERDAAVAAAREVAPAIGMVKVGLELFVGHGPGVVSIGRDAGLPVFLDLKLHDIPETVERAVAQAAKLRARVVTVHASGGRTMLRRAVARASGTGLDVCAVTVLTSLDERDLDDIGMNVALRLPAETAFKLTRGQGGGEERTGTASSGFEDRTAAANDELASNRKRTSLAAENLAQMAWEEGVRWFVCSPAEVRFLRARLGPDAVLVTPGVRPAGTASHDDQKRVATPEQAIREGANWVVVGRPIRDANDRLAAARAIAASIAHVKA